jgi:hypothetical protein
MRLLLLAVPLLQDAGALVEKLGAEDPEVREKAKQSLLAMGEKALPALRKAKDDADATRRAAVLDLIERIDWRATWPCRAEKDLTDDERAFLEEQILTSGLDPSAPAKWEAKKAALPDDLVWTCVKKKRFEKAAVTSVAVDGKVTHLVMRGEAETICLRIGAAKRPKAWSEGFRRDAYPRFYVIEGLTLELADATLAWKEGAVPALSPIWAGPRSDLSLEGESWTKRFKDGAYYRFHWDQDKPFPNLRHLFVKTGWALLVIDYQ